MEKTIKITFTKRELCALLRTWRNGAERRHRFGVVGLRNRVYETYKNATTEAEYESLKNEWKQANTPVEPAAPKKQPKSDSPTSYNYDPSKDQKGV
jgi:hypothetical protein